MSEHLEPYLSVSPLPGFQYSCSLLFIPVDLGNLLVASKVLKHLLGSHQLEHSLKGLGTARAGGVCVWGGGGRVRGRKGGRKDGEGERRLMRCEP